MKNLILLGSTGSVGQSALRIVADHPESFRVVAMAARSSDRLMLEHIRKFHPEAVCLTDASAAARLKQELDPGTKLFVGEEGLCEIAQWSSGHMVIAASSGTSSLRPVLAAIESGKEIAIANKELLVMAGAIMTEAARQKQTPLLPIDSEHNAIFQCLQGVGASASVRRIWLTGSGGPLRGVPSSGFDRLTPEDVLNHPKWNMGKKITVDSASMMNKGLEIIEARWLFGVEPDRIRIAIHPEAVVHSMVELCDGSILAQLGPTDMRLPLLHVMAYPERVSYPEMGLSLKELGELHFDEPDAKKFPCLELALEAARRADSTLPAVMAAADEAAVNAFLEGNLRFSQIAPVIEGMMRRHHVVEQPDLEQVLEAEAWASRETRGRIKVSSRQTTGIKGDR
ncbi:MAG: 1-deoxy-D-xylulose-5-phosphate reductoisomerase [Candidatus Omnitrophica bacterium]|nr:1-deoxy-D-xylulose-5-phosphate reductoisomerase [Candidatus Omnitrophota bacterium]